MPLRKQLAELCVRVVPLAKRRAESASLNRIVMVGAAASILVAITAVTGKTAEPVTAKVPISSSGIVLNPDAAMAAKAAGGQAAREDSANSLPDLSSVSSSPGTFVTFDAPGAVNGTSPFSINPAGAITGNYVDASSQTHGFLRESDGTFVTFDAPGDVNGTFPTSISALETITGYYVDANFFSHGFMLGSDHHVTTFDPQTPFSLSPLASARRLRSQDGIWTQT
jgi:hypothetical protein